MTDQKVWFITVAGRGIGSDLATAAMEAGHFVVATAQDAAAVTAEIGEHERLLVLSMDVTDPDTIERAVREALNRFGYRRARQQRRVVLCRILRDAVPGAGAQPHGGEFVRHAQRHPCRAAGHAGAVPGQIVTVSALLGVVGCPSMSIFTASKHALEVWMESIAPELEPFGITTTIVEPGAFRSKTG